MLESFSRQNQIVFGELLQRLHLSVTEIAILASSVNGSWLERSFRNYWLSQARISMVNSETRKSMYLAARFLLTFTAGGTFYVSRRNLDDVRNKNRNNNSEFMKFPRLINGDCINSNTFDEL